MGYFTEVINGKSAELAPGEPIGEYVVEALIGQGGFGTVYQVVHPVIGKHAAAKVLARRFTHDEQAVTRFIEEARAANTIRSEHILDIFAFGELEDGRRYFVMELLEGESLARHIGRRVRVPPAELMPILDALAAALQAAHERDIVHRDLKPDNVFLHQTPSGSVIPKLLDFGAAKLLGNDRLGPKTETGATLGTPYYMSPEQCLALPIDHRSDVYAFGVLCFEALTGRLPFESQSFLEVASLHANSERPLISQVRPELGDAFDAAVKQMMAIDPDERPATIREAYEQLAQCLKQPIQHMTLRLNTAELEALNEQPTSRQTAIERRDGALAEATEATEATSLRTATTQSPGRGSNVRAWMTWLVTAVVLGLALWSIMWMLWPATPAPQAQSSATVAPTASYSAKIDPHHLKSFQILPAAVSMEGKPLGAAQVELGHRLFFDTVLSRDQDIACNHCHHASAFGADSRRLSPGHAGQLGSRNVPTVYNVAGAFAFHWDGRAATLEQQAAIPLTSTRTMAMTRAEIVKRLKAKPAYVKAFKAAFGDKDPITFEHVTRALGAYQRRLFTPSRWDDFLAGDESALTEKEKRGFNAFVHAGCPTCHYGSRVGLTMYQKLGLVNPWPDSSDPGRQGITMNAEDWMIFRVPTLRNIDGTSPYLHDGSVKQLREVVRLMAYHQLDRRLTNEEVDIIVAWLQTLTGRIPKDLTTPLP